MHKPRAPPCVKAGVTGSTTALWRLISPPPHTHTITSPCRYRCGPRGQGQGRHAAVSLTAARDTAARVPCLPAQLELPDGRPAIWHPAADATLESGRSPNATAATGKVRLQAPHRSQAADARASDSQTGCPSAPDEGSSATAIGYNNACPKLHDTRLVYGHVCGVRVHTESRAH